MKPPHSKKSKTLIEGERDGAKVAACAAPTAVGQDARHLVEPDLGKPTPMTGSENALLRSREVEMAASWVRATAAAGCIASSAAPSAALRARRGAAIVNHVPKRKPARSEPPRELNHVRRRGSLPYGRTSSMMDCTRVSARSCPLGIAQLPPCMQACRAARCSRPCRTSR